jgi:hypothetical protein
MGASPDLHPPAAAPGTDRYALLAYAEGLQEQLARAHALSRRISDILVRL